MASFVVPKIHDNADGWGPINLPEKSNSIPYAPFSKSDKLGKSADWLVDPKFPSRTYNTNPRYGAFSNVTTAFSYVHNEDEDSFTLVENRPAKAKYPVRRYGPARSNLRQQQFQTGQQQTQKAKQLQKGGRPLPGQRNTRLQTGTGNRRWPSQSAYEASKRARDFSIDIRPEWTLLEQFDFNSLQKLATNVEEPEDLYTAGSVEYYDKSYDRVTTKNEKSLERIERTFFKVSTSDDPIIRKLSMDGVGNVFATDAILAVIMSATRSVYSWDVVVHKVGNRLFFDKRDNSQFDFLTVNETANEPPFEEKDSINSPHSLSQEATFINQNFSQQVLLRTGKSYSFEHPNPFVGEEEVGPIGSVGYRYRKWKLSDDLTLVARCEVEGVLPSSTSNKEQFISIKALNEYDPKVGGLDWRQKLDTQRGAVLATELKNNSNKLARWAAQAILAGASFLTIGYVSRVQPKDNFNHVVLGVNSHKPKDFASQINLNINNMWGILRVIIDICFKLPDGKYLLLKDPNKSLLGLYEISQDTFEDPNSAPAETAQE
jgi:translation initiation factor 3 subunit D